MFVWAIIVQFIAVFNIYYRQKATARMYLLYISQMMPKSRAGVRYTRGLGPTLLAGPEFDY